MLRNRLEGMLACSGSALRTRGHPPRLETRDHPTYGEIGDLDLTVVTESGETMVSEELSCGDGCHSPSSPCGPHAPRALYPSATRRPTRPPLGNLRLALSQLAWAHLKAVGAVPPPRGSRVLCDETHGRRTVGLGVGCSRLDQHVIDVAIAPVFSRLEGPDNRVPRVVEVCGCVLVLRFIAATYVPARQAFPEMYPLVPGPEAFLAALGGGNYGFSYLISVCTPLSPEHLYFPPTYRAWV